jgi:hypothetical protein
MQIPIKRGKSLYMKKRVEDEVEFGKTKEG